MRLCWSAGVHCHQSLLLHSFGQSSKQEPSKRNKRVKKNSNAKLGLLSFLAITRRRLLTTNEIVQAIYSEEGHLLKLIEEEQPVAPQSGANGQSVEEQINFTTPTNEQSEEQGEIHYS